MIRRIVNRLIRDEKKNREIESEFPLCELHDSRSTSAELDPYLIPSIVYQTWQDNLFGRTHFSALNRFRSLNSNLSFKLYNQSDIQQYMKCSWSSHPIFAIFTNSRFGPMKADIFRYCILYERGGYYFDINKGCNVPIRSLHQYSTTCLISFEQNDCTVLPNENVMKKLQNPNKYILNWALGFTKNHVILETTIANICKYYKYFKNVEYKYPKNAILSLTGPGMLTKTIRETIDNHSTLDITQAGIDLNGEGIFDMSGSYIRYRTAPSYGQVRNAVIVS